MQTSQMVAVGRAAGLAARRWAWSEGDVFRVLGGAHADGLGRRAVAAGGLGAGEELHGVGDDLDALALAAVVCRPFAPLQPSVDRDRPALGEVAGAVLALGAPDGDVEVVGHVDP